MMCGRHQPVAGADSGDDPRLSMLRAMQAYEAASAELARGNVGQVVYILRDLSADEHDLVEDMLLADGHPEPPAASVRGQAMVETALVLPLLLLVIVAGLGLGLAMFDRSTLTWAAQEGARAAAEAPSDPERCDAARAAIETTTGRNFGACPTPERFSLTYVEGEPRGIRVRIEGSTWPTPFIGSGTVTVAGEAGAIIRPTETEEASE